MRPILFGVAGTISANVRGQKTPPRRKAIGDTTAPNRDRLGLLPFGPDPVRRRSLHRPRSLSTAAAVESRSDHHATESPAAPPREWSTIVGELLYRFRGGLPVPRSPFSVTRDRSTARARAGRVGSAPRMTRR